MNRSTEVPRAVVEFAERQIRSTGRPFLYAPKAVGEWRLDALPGENGRFLLVLAPDALPIIREIAISNGGTVDEMADRLLEKLMRAATVSIEREPPVIECEGRQIGTLEIDGELACVNGPITLTCLSWIFRTYGRGFYIRLVELIHE